MANLKNFKESLKSRIKEFQLLTNQEKKLIIGGYTTKEECQEDCGHWHTWPGGPTGTGTCYVVSANPERWECRDS